MKKEHIKVLAVEDDPDFMQLLQKLLGQQEDMQLVGHTSIREEALAMADTLQPDVVLMDLNLTASRMDGIDIAKEIRLNSYARVIILTVFENPEIVIEASKRSFASGYVFKSSYGMLPDIVRAAAQGKLPQECMIQNMILNDLSSAEKSIFELMMGKRIELFSSHKTIANQKTNVLKKLGLKSQKELVKVFSYYH